jgi:hypothetical protein
MGRFYFGRWFGSAKKRKTRKRGHPFYIHLNLVRARLVKDPAEYPWSSYRKYLKGGSGGAIGIGFVLSQFSFADCFHRAPAAMSHGIAKVEGRAGSDKELGQKRKIKHYSCLPLNLRR